MLILRPVAESDLDAIVALAQQLDSMNLPSDRDFLARARAGLAALLRGQPGRLAQRRVRLRARGHARPDARSAPRRSSPSRAGRECPTSGCAVTSEERRSDELGKRFVHTKLQLMSTEDGPTEIGGLILDPDYRRHPERCGKALSIVRFAYISLHPDRFEREVIAEMLSPFEAPGKNLLWDAFGARFTGLPYREADHLSSRTKQFIADLFPRDPVYATLFPKRGAGRDRQARARRRRRPCASSRRSASAT